MSTITTATVRHTVALSEALPTVGNPSEQGSASQSISPISICVDPLSAAPCCPEVCDVPDACVAEQDNYNVSEHGSTSSFAEWWDKIIKYINNFIRDDRGMSTVEYALGCVAAAALGALLYTVVTSDTVEQALSGIFERALNQGNNK